MDKLAAYNKLNNSFQKKYIFNFGSEGGFYSEFNNMVFAMVYCLKYKYRFILYSDNSKFKIKKGWDDFFEPFCEEIGSSYFHKKFNKRIDAPRLTLKHYPAWYAWKWRNKDTYLTYELFGSFFNGDFEKEQFDFPELGIKGNLREVSRQVVDMIYRFNSGTQTEIKKMISQLNLPEKYISLNVRRGDKDTEFSILPLSTYMDKVKQLADLKDIFVLSDDYTVLEELQKEYPENRYYTLVNPSDRGYIHGDFIKTGIEKKKADLIKLFASVEAMAASDLAIGTLITNPGLFLGMYMPEDKFVSVQKQAWYQFERDDVEKDRVK
jgi:hypothetical protein